MRGVFWYNKSLMGNKKGVVRKASDVADRIETVGKQFRTFWKKHGTKKNIAIGSSLIGVVVLTVSGTLLWRAMFCAGCSQGSIPQPATISTTIRHPLTGAVLSAELDSLPNVFGVMIENSADAWPLSGVSDAFLVIEAPVEGNIPRFIAFYSSDQVDVAKIGPVRSSRVYYLDWAQEFNAIYAHVGGSPAALEAIKEHSVLDLDQFFQSEYFYRDELTRYAPHNVYTTLDDLKRSFEEIDEKYENAAPRYDAWMFADAPASTTKYATVIHVDWSNSSGYNVDWAYDPSTNLYTRKQGENTYVDTNVVIMESDIDVIAGDDKGRKELKTIGEGPMHLFQNGEEIVGTWKKPSAEERLRFYDTNDTEVVMNAGKTWIEVVDSLDRLQVQEEDGRDFLE